MSEGLVILLVTISTMILSGFLSMSADKSELIHRNWLRKGELAIWQWLLMISWLPLIIPVEICVLVGRLLKPILMYKPSLNKDRIR